MTAEALNADLSGDETLPAPVTGEIVSVDAVIPTEGEQNAAADRARGRTTIQVGVPTAIVNILVWGARLKGWDLNPLPDSADIPPDVATNIAAVMAIVACVRMNPKSTSEPWTLKRLWRRIVG